MTKLQKTLGGATTYARRGVVALLVFACALCALAAFATEARAQSGRRSPNMSKSSPPPAASGTKVETPPGTQQVAKPLASFVVLEDENAHFDSDFVTRRLVMESFSRRLGQSPLVVVSKSGKGSRKDARDRAKTEKESFVVLVELEEQQAEQGVRVGGGNRAEDRALVIKTYVYAPATGDLKFTDRFLERPYRQTATIGGVRVPVPSRRYPTEAQLEQVGRDAADRLLSRFQISPPRDN